MIRTLIYQKNSTARKLDYYILLLGLFWLRLNFRDQSTISSFFSPSVVGNKCSGTCEHRYRRPPHCQSLAEEIKKMLDDCHILGPDYCRHYCTFYSEAMEKEVINWEHKNNGEFIFIHRQFFAALHPKYLHAILKQSSQAAVLIHHVPSYLFYHLIVSDSNALFCFSVLQTIINDGNEWMWWFESLPYTSQRCIQSF